MSHRHCSGMLKDIPTRVPNALGKYWVKTKLNRFLQYKTTYGSTISNMLSQLPNLSQENALLGNGK